MAFPIDVAFLDSQGFIIRLVPAVLPGRVPWPVWGATAVLELGLNQGFELGLQRGEQLLFH